MDAGKTRLLNFLRAATAAAGGALRSADAQRFELRTDSEATPILCTLDRDLARTDDSLTLLTIDHPLVRGLRRRWQQLDPADLGACITLGLPRAAVLSVWLVRAFGAVQDAGSYLVPIAVDTAGRREPSLEKRFAECFRAPVGVAALPLPERTRAAVRARGADAAAGARSPRHRGDGGRCLGIAPGLARDRCGERLVQVGATAVVEAHSKNEVSTQCRSCWMLA